MKSQSYTELGLKAAEDRARNSVLMRVRQNELGKWFATHIHVSSTGCTEPTFGERWMFAGEIDRERKAAQEELPRKGETFTLHSGVTGIIPRRTK